MDVPTGPLRQDAELGRSRCESEVFSEKRTLQREAGG